MLFGRETYVWTHSFTLYTVVESVNFLLFGIQLYINRGKTCDPKRVFSLFSFWSFDNRSVCLRCVVNVIFTVYTFIKTHVAIKYSFVERMCILLVIQIIDSIYRLIYTVENLYNDFIILPRFYPSWKSCIFTFFKWNLVLFTS